MIVSYKLSRKSLNSLRKKGLSDTALESLSALEERWFETAEAFVQQLRALPASGELQPQESLILRQAKGYFRLDKWIHNRTLREWVEALIFALVVATVVRTYIVAPFKIPSGSMLPTIQIGDHIFASMWSYGFKVPFSQEKLAPQEVLRGDIVIFPYPRDPSIDYIKRAIGLPGETIEVRNDQVFINGEPLEEPYAYFDPQQRFQSRATAPVSFFGPVKIPEGKLFVMGDNRYNSADSRFWGFVDINTLMGKGQMIYWNHDPRESLVSGYQIDRIFSFLQ
ncbi:MAG: signal peptidase I [bacterium]|jgi:signal peptidase I